MSRGPRIGDGRLAFLAVLRLLATIGLALAGSGLAAYVALLGHPLAAGAAVVAVLVVDRILALVFTRAAECATPVPSPPEPPESMARRVGPLDAATSEGQGRRDAKVSYLGRCPCGGEVRLQHEPVHALIHEEPACELYRRSDARSFLEWLGTAGHVAG